MSYVLRVKLLAEQNFQNIWNEGNIWYLLDSESSRSGSVGD